jgi:HEPN domain-containing protein
MTEINELKSWVSSAEDDFRASKELLRLQKPLASASCFHAQQCGEKYLKALLILKDVDFPKTHDLLTLDTLCNQAGIFTGFVPQFLSDLSKHAVQSRYPGNQPVLDEAKEALKIVTTIRRFARTFLGLKK